MRISNQETEMQTLNGCKAKTKRGTPCQMPRLADAAYCFTHDPTRQRDRSLARTRGGLNRRVPKANPLAIGSVSLRDIDAIQALLELAVRDTLVQENSGQRSRILGYLAGLAMKALEVGDLAKRVETLEERIAGTA
jgi:hypothetical protein